ncbi:MAG: RloB family protein [Opitutaceae bacterium]
MSDFDPLWFKQAAAQSLERKAAKGITAYAGDTFLIVTEGEVSEPTYFTLLRTELQLKAVTVKIQPSWASDPRHVINAAADEVKDLAKRARRSKLANDEVAKYDHVWAVIDTDVAERYEIWHEVEALAKSKKVKLAHSTPCFEFWLLLHLGYTTRADLVDGTTAKKAVEDALGHPYSTNKATAEEAMKLFLDKWPDAVRNAEKVRAHHVDARSPSPANPSTEVDIVVRALNDAAPKHKQRL